MDAEEELPDRIMRTALGWFALTTVTFWLPAVRGAFDGPTYEWGIAGFGGRGLDGDYWLPLIGALGALALLAGGWRLRRWAFATVAAWSLLLFGVIGVVVALNPGNFRLSGDTLGFDVSVGWVGVALSGLASALSVLAAWRACRRPRVVAAPWRPQNSRWLALLAAALPLQFALLRFGGVASRSDQIGVLITIVQWLLVGRIFRSYPP